MTAPDGNALAAIALEAGAILQHYYDVGCGSESKSDDSPVTIADREAEALIAARLAALAPAIPMVGEEAASAGDIPAFGSIFFLVDPLDGTREFLEKRADFTVNIALIRDGKPVAGVVYAPARRALYVAVDEASAWYADADPGGAVPGSADRQAIHVRSAPAEGIVAVASRSHRSPETDAFLDRYVLSDCRSAGSSLKFCLVATGEADLYPRLGRTMEWDTAAGQAVVEAAGGAVFSIDGAPLRYGKRERGLDNPHFVVVGDLSLAAGFAGTL